MRVWRSVMVALAVGPFALVAACSVEEAPAATPQPVRLTVDDAVPAREGTDFESAGTVTAVLDGRTARYVGRTSDGAELLVRDSLSATGDRTKVDPSAVALVVRESSSGVTTVLTDRARHQGPVATDRLPGDALQIGPVAMSGDVVVWIESSRLDVGDLYAHDLATGRETVLASAEDAGEGEQVLPAVSSEPVLLGDDVYFVGAHSDELPAASSVYAVPVDGSAAPVEIVADATAVFGDTDGRLQVRFADRLVRWDPALGAEGEVEGSSLPAPGDAFAHAGVRVRVVPGAVEVDSAEHGRFVIDTGPAGIGDLDATDRWVSLTLEGRGLLLDLRRGTLVRLRDATASSTGVGGAAFVEIAQSRGARPRAHRLLELLPGTR